MKDIEMNNYQRLLGAGPRGLIISVVLLIIAFQTKPYLNLPNIHGNANIGIFVFGVTILITVLLIVWSAKSLNPNKRGRELVTTNAFKFFRHPLYAAFLTFFNFGLAVFLDNYIFLIWAVLQHPIWHLNVANEERMISKIFPKNYDKYCQRTGRFFPRIK